MLSKKSNSILGKRFCALLLTFSLLMTLVIPTAFAAAPMVFSACTAYPVGVSPALADTGDIDGDGNEDIVTSNTGGGTISILFGNGDGTFDPQVTYPVSSPYGIAAGDLNGDGRDEIAVTAYNSPYNVTILTFDHARNLIGNIGVPVGAPCYYALITDLDRDGNFDLLVSSISASCVYILYGTGTGLFSETKQLLGATSACGIGVGDFNGDGYSDVAVGSAGGVSIRVFYGIVGRNFGAVQTSAVYSGADVYPEYVTTGDFNHDGYSDVAASIYYGNYYSVLFGSATGLGAFLLSGMTSNCYNAVILSEDFDGDGYPDLAMQTNANNVISIYRGSITGPFNAGVLFPVAGTPGVGTGLGMAGGDFNNDKKPDLAVVNANINSVSILLNNTGIPTISDISDTSCVQGTSTGTLSFTVSDDVTSADSLTVSAVSGNAVLVPNDGTHFTFGGSGTNRTLVVTPASAQTGTSTITVKVTDGDGSMQSDTFLLTVTMNDASCVAADKAALAVTYGGSDTAASVTQNVTLPAAGANGTTITWSSNQTSTVSNAGAVSRPGSTQGNKAVTLTATVTKGLASDTKDFALTVTALGEDDTVAADKAALAVTYGGSDTAASVTQNITLPTAGVKGSSVTWASGDTSVISDTGAVTRPSYTDGDKSVTLTATISSGSSTATKTFDLTVLKQAAPDDDDDDGETQSAGAVTALNGQARAQMATLDNSTAGVSIITFNSNNLSAAMQSAQSGSTVTVQAGNLQDHVRVMLNGQDVKALENKQTVLQVETAYGTYTLPAARLNIDSIRAQFGESAELADIGVQINIVHASGNTAVLLQNAASTGGFTIAAPAVDFSVTCTFGGKTAEVSRFDSYVRRSIAIPDGTDPAKVTTGILVYPDGTVEHVPTKVVRVEGVYYAQINSLSNSTYALIWNPVEFSDVAAHWAKDAVNDMGSRLIISGVGNGSFEPDRSITRAEFAAILVRALGLAPEDGESGYTDVAATDWYSGAIKTAASYGLVTGYPDDSFGPNDTITREQAMTMIYRAMKLTGLESSLTAAEPEAALAGYSDFQDASGYAAEGISACLRTGVATGKDGGAIAPRDTVTRAEIAVMIQRLLQKSGLI